MNAPRFRWHVVTLGCALFALGSYGQSTMLVAIGVWIMFEGAGGTT